MVTTHSISITKPQPISKPSPSGTSETTIRNEWRTDIRCSQSIIQKLLIANE